MGIYMFSNIYYLLLLYLRPISLLSVSGKVFAHILLARIQPLLDKCRRPQQSAWFYCRAVYYGCHISLEIVGRVTPKF